MFVVFKEDFAGNIPFWYSWFWDQIAVFPWVAVFDFYVCMWDRISLFFYISCLAFAAKIEPFTVPFLWIHNVYVILTAWCCDDF